MLCRWNLLCNLETFRSFFEFVEFWEFWWTRLLSPNGVPLAPLAAAVPPLLFALPRWGHGSISTSESSLSESSSKADWSISRIPGYPLVEPLESLPSLPGNRIGNVISGGRSLTLTFLNIKLFYDRPIYSSMTWTPCPQSSRGRGRHDGPLVLTSNQDFWSNCFVC